MKNFLLDFGYTDESIEGIIDAMMNSLKRIFPIGMIIILRGQCTDSGDGGLKAALARDIFKRNLAHPHYLIMPCILHNLQT